MTLPLIWSRNYGVLQQWVAIHHLRQQELFLVLNTATKVFPLKTVFS